jgi:hypothetical protein
MHMMEQTPEAEAGSHRSSGHRIENAPLIEYQMFESNVFMLKLFQAALLELCAFKTTKTQLIK